jgi:hypothetical protein
VSGHNGSVVAREPDRFGFGNEVTHGEDQSVRADYRSVTDALGSQNGGGERLVGNFRMHEHDGTQCGVEIEAQIRRLRLQSRGKGPVAGFSHRSIMSRVGWSPHTHSTHDGRPHAPAVCGGCASDEAGAFGSLVAINELNP